MKLAFLLLLNLFFVGEWGLDFNQALTDSKQNNKLILLNFSGSDWCGPCIKLKKDVFESAEFKTFAEDKLVLIRADFPRLKKNQLDKIQQDKNDVLAEKYNPNGKFPLTVLIDSKGKVLHEFEGYQPSISKFISEIKHFN
ncbi:thioredoxin family protein [Aquirufa sp. ROCK2-A2]